MAVQIAIFPLLDPLGILRLAHDLCIFSLWNPDNSNDCVHFVRHLPFSSYFCCRMHPLDACWHVFFSFFRLFFENVLPALSGKHIFEKQLQALSMSFCPFLLCADAVPGGFRRGPDCWDVRLAQQNILVWHMDPPRSG